MKDYQKHDTIAEYRSWVESLEFDPVIGSYQQKLLKNNEFEKFLCVGNQFMYIADFVNPQIVFISPGVKDVLGYEAKRFYDDLYFLYEIIHPDDLPIVLKATKKTVSLAFKHKDIRPFEGIFLIDYRVRKADGNYIRIMRQTGIFKKDKKRNLVYSFGICTDISDIKKVNRVDFSMTGQDAKIFDFPYEEFEKLRDIFTNREKEVLKLLKQGKTSKEIAGILFISPLTVISHRNNMMEKTCTKNSAELIAHVLENGLHK